MSDRPASPAAAALLLGALLSSALGAVACSSAPEREPLPLQEAPDFSSREGAALEERWWEAFGDARLAAQVELGLSGSFELRAAFERLAAARALAAREGAALSPTLDAFIDGSLRDGNLGGNLGAAFQQTSQVNVGLDAAYELDLWGRLRKSIDVREFEAAATAEDYQAAAVGLSAELALAVLRLTEAAAQLELIESQLQVNGDVLQVLESRFAIGQIEGADVLRQRQLLEATREQRVVERTSRELLQHQLAVLQGRPPQALVDVELPDALPRLPELPAVGLPAELVERRPDVRAAMLRLESSDAAVAVAVRDRYPRLTLSASASTRSEDFTGLFDSWLASLGAQIVGPLVDGGRRRSEIERTVAVRRQRLAEFGSALLLAFAEVEDALALEKRRAERLESIELQLELASRTYTNLRSKYLNGAADFIDVLTALRDRQALERGRLEASLLRLEARIALHRAIAGGLPEEDLGPSAHLASSDGATETAQGEQTSSPRTELVR